MKPIIPALSAALFLLSLFGTPSFAQAPKTTATSVESPEIRELQKVEDKWSNALNQRDQYGLELVLSPLFVGVSSTGDVTTRNQQVVATINQEDKTAFTETRVVTVRMLGDVAIASGTYTYTHHVSSGPAEEKGIFTHVYQRQHGIWVCLNAQRTTVRQDNAGKTKAAKPRSGSELPFHIPLFSKGDKGDKADKADQVDKPKQ